MGAYTQVRAEALVFEHELGFAPNVSSSWPNKIPKLMWRGVPMVEVRQVSRGISSTCKREGEMGS